MEYLQYQSKIQAPTIDTKVLNLVINGIPSILNSYISFRSLYLSFKPCYKWNTFNTDRLSIKYNEFFKVLNLVINGIPSILPQIGSSSNI